MANSTLPRSTIEPGTIESLLSNESHNLKQLEQVLLAEREAISNRDSERLQQHLTEKALLLEALTHNSESRQHTLEQAGYKHSPDNWRNALKQLDHTHQTQFFDHWQKIETGLRQCQQENEINAKMAARTQHTINQILDALRGQLGQPKLYDQKGYAGNSTNSQSLRTISQA